MKALMEKNLNNNRSFFYCFLLSLLLHIPLALVSKWEVPRFSTKEDSFEVSLVPVKKREKLQSLRTLGVKGGAKGAQVALKAGQVKAPVEKKADKKGQSPKPNITLKSLKPERIVHQQVYVPPRRAYSMGPLVGQPLNLPSISDELKQLLAKSSVQIQMEVPEGVSFDQLNPQELVFYGFKKRLYQKYLGSFLRNLNELQREHPRLGFSRQDVSYSGRLFGSIVFDEQGNIRTLRVHEGSSNIKLQRLFEETLSGIQNLPNPPDLLISENKTIKLYFALTL
jgi:hypothetical protein